MEKDVKVLVDANDLLNVLEFYKNIKYGDEILRTCQNDGFREHVRMLYKAKIVKDSFDILQVLFDEAFEYLKANENVEVVATKKRSVK